MTILEFLYNTVPGRFLLKPLTGPRLSRICGHFLDSELSSFLIQPFVKQNAIQLSDYETTDIKSFNDFFSRGAPVKGACWLGYLRHPLSDTYRIE